jgi:release factor glutamine methyltransferase
VQISQIIARLNPVYPEHRQAQQVAAWLLEKLLNLPGAQILTKQELLFSEQQAKILEEWLDQIINQHKPLAYILGNVPFLNLDILVEPPILIPRLETEWWIDVLIKRFNSLKDVDLKILDLCAGSGCIGLALAKYFPKSHVTLVDIAQPACDLVAKNMVHNKIENATVLQSDLYHELVDQKFDLIVANPPYIPAHSYANLDLSVRLWEDRRALVAPESDLQIIAKIIALAPHYLQKKYANLPQLWLEIDATQGKPVSDLMCVSFEQIELIVDQFDRQRVVVGKI